MPSAAAIPAMIIKRRIEAGTHDFSSERRPVRAAGNWKHVGTQRAERMGGGEREADGGERSVAEEGKTSEINLYRLNIHESAETRIDSRVV